MCAATSAQYVPSEPLNQQYLRKVDNPPCMTVQFVVKGTMACTDDQASLSVTENTVTAKSELWQADYCFEDSALNISLSCENGTYNLPIVCLKNQTVEVSADRLSISVDGNVTVKSDTPLICDTAKRTFHQVGGLSYLPISVNVNGKASLALFGQ